MKKIFLLFSLLFAMCAKAQTIEDNVLTYEADCLDSKMVANTLTAVYEEIPIITGQAGDMANSFITFWINPIKKTWTFVATYEDVSCIIGTGTKFNLVPYQKRKLY